LPPLAAWWKGSDIELFQRLGLLDVIGAQRRREQRALERNALVVRLRRESARRAFAGRLKITDSANDGDLTIDLAAAIHAFLARTPCQLLGLQFDDLSGAEVPVNVPGTSDEYPNWQLRSPVPIETAAGGRRWSSIVEAVTRERHRS
jgi:4-alpha-glucanotransferase